MPTYNEVVDGHSPLVLMQSNGSTIVDQSSNTLPLITGTSAYNPDLHGFRKTVADQQVDGTFTVQWRNPDPLKRYMVIVQDDNLGEEFEPIARDNIEAVDV